MGKRAKRKVFDEHVEDAFVEEVQDEYRRQKKILRHNFTVKEILPLTHNQELVFHAYNSNKNVFLCGCAGTGKTFLASYFALSDLLLGNTKRIILIRSAVTTRDQGFLPGTLQEKMALYEAPYRDIFADLCNNRRDVYDLLKKRGYLEFMSTSFLRGVTFDDAVIVLDEVQNMTWHEIHSVLTRVGKNSKVIICGDGEQDDLKMTGKKNQQTGIQNLIKVANYMDEFELINFTIDDIVRSGFVKKFIIASYYLKLTY